MNRIQISGNVACEAMPQWLFLLRGILMYPFLPQVVPVKRKSRKKTKKIKKFECHKFQFGNVEMMDDSNQWLPQLDQHCR